MTDKVNTYEYNKVVDKLRKRVKYAKDEEEKQQRIKELQDYKLSQGRISKRDKTKAQRRYYYRRLLKQELEKDIKNIGRMNQLIREIETNNSEFDEELLIRAKEYLEK